MQMRFTGMLLSVEQREFSPTEGANKGTRYTWSELSFNTKEDGSFVIKTLAPIEVDEKQMRVERDWSLGMKAKGKGDFRIASIQGGKAAGA